MNYKKCPRCKLNYIKEDETLCHVCKNELNMGADEKTLVVNKRSEVIKAGDVFPFDKDYQLINHLTGRELKGWGRATYTLTKLCYIWMIALDGVTRNGWSDKMLQDGRIKEEYFGDKQTIPSNFGLTFDYPYKAVFEKTGDSFVFRGVYKLDKNDTSLYERYYVKVSDTTTLYDF